MNAVAASSPRPLQIKGLHHVAIIASDYARSRHFYTQVLGLPVVHEMYRTERQSHKLDLQLPDAADAVTGQSLVVLGAARLGKTRLIDNFEI